MQLDGGLKGHIEEQLIIRAALHPVLGRALGVVKSTGLGGVKQRAHCACVVVGVEDLAVSDFDLVGNVGIATGQICTSPARGRGAAGSRLESLGLLCNLLGKFLELKGVGAVCLVLELSVAENQEARGPGNTMSLCELAIFIKVDLDEGNLAGAGEGVRQAFVDCGELSTEF